MNIWSMMQLQWFGLLAFFPLSSPVDNTADEDSKQKGGEKKAQFVFKELKKLTSTFTFFLEQTLPVN